MKQVASHRMAMARQRAAKARSLASCTIRNWLDDGADTLGAALAFYCAFSLVPLLVILLTLAGWIVGETSAQAFLQSQLTLLFGSQTTRVILAAMRNSQQAKGLAAAVVSTVTLLITATSVLAALDEALEKILGGAPRTGSGISNWLRRRLLSFGFILSLSFVLLVSLTISTVIAGMRSWIAHRYSWLMSVVGALDLAISIGLMTSVFALMYRYVPVERLPWRQVIGGGLLTAVLFSIGKWAVSLYLAKSTVPSAFGAAASFVALLLWLYYTAEIFLLGAEFTACLGGLRLTPQPK
ncbi:MAG TPA: YihY/virulence factor BrkB family protein [Steroidobacteraceae bacterium]|nr:YihY/virulence factor BrkB family protein [Steroidobacteraceae bacterium]